MTKEKYKQLEEESQKQILENHTIHLRALETRLQALETNLGNIKQDIIKDAVASVEATIETKTKYTVKDLKKAVIETTDLHYSDKLKSIEDQLDSLDNAVDKTIADYKNLSRNILENRTYSEVEKPDKFQIHTQLVASFGLIVTGRVTDIQRLLDDLESYYHVTMIFNKTVQYPRKLMLVEDDK